MQILDSKSNFLALSKNCSGKSMYLMVTPKVIITLSYQLSLIMITHQLTGSMSHIRNGDSKHLLLIFTLDRFRRYCAITIDVNIVRVYCKC